MLVRHRMSAPAISVRPDTSFQQALALMRERGIRRLPVIDDQQRLVGIVAQRDLLIAALRYLTSKADVSEVMAKNVVTVAPDVSLTVVAQLMLKHKVGGLPVIEEGTLVGVITESDLFRTFVELHTMAEAEASDVVQLNADRGRQSKATGLPRP